jgi:hypothetical protein
MQKFSSNVVEKVGYFPTLHNIYMIKTDMDLRFQCIRVSDLSARRALVEELSGRQQLERLLRDSLLVKKSCAPPACLSY